MPEKPYQDDDLTGNRARFGPFTFSDSLLQDMAAYLSKERGRPVSLEEANESLVKLTYFMKWILDREKPPSNEPQ